MKSKGTKGIVGSSIKSSLMRYFNSGWFSVLSFLFVVCLQIYVFIGMLGAFESVGVVSRNAKALASDTTIEKVSYINDEGVVFLDNGDRVEDYSVTRVTWGNAFWYSVGGMVLGVPMELRECIIEGVTLLVVVLLSFCMEVLIIRAFMRFWSDMEFSVVAAFEILYALLCVHYLFADWVSLFENNTWAYLGAYLVCLVAGVCSVFIGFRVLVGGSCRDDLKDKPAK